MEIGRWDISDKLSNLVSAWLDKDYTLYLYILAQKDFWNKVLVPAFFIFIVFPVFVFIEILLATNTCC